MQDRQVFEQILGITSPWFVSQVELALNEGEVRVALQHRADAVALPGVWPALSLA